MDASVIVPVVGIIFGLSIPLLAIWTDYKKERALIEKGLHKPEKPDESGPRWHGTFLWGLILTLVAVALMVGSSHVPGLPFQPGPILLAVGVALLVYSFVVKLEKRKE